ncbi:hypothetical protein SVAN01_04816 [Stagonosporopsis vannaccii]|nr:hypothetical protein SVAN01_04816 [Stagonosporopsis vannaccii]
MEPQLLLQPSSKRLLGWRPQYANQAIPAVLTRIDCAHAHHHRASTQRAAPHLGRPFISCNTRNVNSHPQPTFRSKSSIRHARPMKGPAAGRIAWFLH